MAAAGRFPLPLKPPPPRRIAPRKCSEHPTGSGSRARSARVGQVRAARALSRIGRRALSGQSIAPTLPLPFDNRSARRQYWGNPKHKPPKKKPLITVERLVLAAPPPHMLPPSVIPRATIRAPREGERGDLRRIARARGRAIESLDRSGATSKLDPSIWRYCCDYRTERYIKSHSAASVACDGPQADACCAGRAAVPSAVVLNSLLINRTLPFGFRSS